MGQQLKEHFEYLQDRQAFIASLKELGPAILKMAVEHVDILKGLLQTANNEKWGKKARKGIIPTFITEAKEQEKK